jgi:hypothetical protein
MATTTCTASPEDILACQFDRWFPHFQEHTMKSRVIPLQENFVAYLLEDGVILPAVPDGGKFGTDELSDDEGVVEHVDDDDAAAAVVDDFHELTAQIVRGIADLKGEVFVKLNWSAPLDASWLKGGSMKCTSSSDVYLLLKSSDRVAFDIEHMFDLCTTAATTVTSSSSSSSVSSSGSSSNRNSVHRPDAYHLVLRKWANLNPAMEFRLFCAADAILGLCQRDLSTYYDFLANEADDLEDLIVEFWETKIRGKFGLTKCKTFGDTRKATPFRCRGRHVHNCCLTTAFTCTDSVDLYVDKRRRVWIVDFNPFGEPSSPLLFDWDELLAVCDQAGAGTTAATTTVEAWTSAVQPTTGASASASAGLCAQSSLFPFRLIERKEDALPSPAGASRGPIDVTLAPDFHKFMEICRQQQREEES